MVAFQLTIDCADPEGQAHFWATALRYRVEDAPDGFPTVGAPPRRSWGRRGGAHRCCSVEFSVSK
ncbi:VOC family protein [Actinacidiphila glaucinigra]|uniref:VOC family protein n=1 Tax=Actinacidiphila glaucinigra TaxID=235986 RepID=UPI002E347F28|nr:VOC family protein [Actinacidiphila glaucinigra]